MEFDALMLSRIQFAFTISFHIIFPAFTIGLASWLARLEFEWLRSGNPETLSQVLGAADWPTDRPMAVARTATVFVGASYEDALEQTAL